ncbi:MAG TPA: protein kinase, partial [Candidatus Acidoferrales bacterium]|nr:protein kinase [Candidatus Acidoferrales bacterium]
AAMGTISYMSPEQARGEELDPRTDLFSFGLVLYEMATGRQAFPGNTSAVVFDAILNKVPPPATSMNPALPPKLEEVISRALEKDCELRVQTASEIRAELKRLKRDLDSTRTSSVTTSSSAAASGSSRAVNVAAAPTLAKRVSPATIAIAAVLLVVAAAVAGIFAGKRIFRPELPLFHRVTFRHGTILNARFAPDGQTMVYSAAWEGNAPEIFTARPESPESRPLHITDTEVVGVSSSGELAVLLKPRLIAPWVNLGTLARLPLAGGGAPREVLDDVVSADWSPDGTQLMVDRRDGAKQKLEYPIGKTLYETIAWISSPRVSPKGDLVAFLDHPQYGDDEGSVVVVDAQGKTKQISSGWISLRGLAWKPDGSEIYFTGTKSGLARSLYAVTLSGSERLVARSAGYLTLHDVSHDGHILAVQENDTALMSGLPPNGTREVNLSWLDFTVPRDLSLDGEVVLFDETGEGGGGNGTAYVRSTDGSPAIRLGDGVSDALSPDKKWAIINPPQRPGQYNLVPTGAGEARSLTNDAINHLAAGVARFVDAKRFVFLGNQKGHGLQFFVQSIEGGEAKAISPEGIGSARFAVSHDGQFVVGTGSDHKTYLYPINGGEPRVVNGVDDSERAISFTGDDRGLFVYKFAELPAKIFRMDLATGKRTFWRSLAPGDAAGVDHLGGIIISRDEKSYVYTYAPDLTDLYLVEGVK